MEVSGSAANTSSNMNSPSLMHPGQNGAVSGVESPMLSPTRLDSDEDRILSNDFHPTAITPNPNSVLLTTTAVTAPAPHAAMLVNISEPRDVIAATSYSSNGHISTTSTNSVGLSSKGHTEVSREEIIRTIFGDVGDLLNDFSCAVESTVLLHGRMYVTTRFLCFYSNLFGLEKKIRVPYSHITLVTKENTAMVIPNAIAVTTHRKEYLFRSFWDREECFKLLQELISRQRYLENGGHVDTPSGLQSPSTEKTRPVTQRVTTNTTNKLNNNQSIQPGVTNGNSTNNTVALPSNNIRNGADEESDIETGVVRKPLDLNADFVSLFEEEVNNSKLKYIISTLDHLPISVKDFMSMFVEDDAVHSWKKFHESGGDTSVEATQWHSMSSSLGFGREIKFVKPIPAIKSSTRGVKVQRYRRFGDYGLVICSSTRLENVPGADAFSVEDMIAIKSENGDRVSVSISFEVKFIKSTWFRSVIESNTNAEMNKWLESFYQKLKTVSHQNRGEGNKSNNDSSNNLVRIDSITPLNTNTNTQAIAVPNSNETNTKDRIASETSSANTNASSSPIDSILDSLGLPGGRIFWSTWLILFLSFMFFGYQYMIVSRRLHNMEIQLRNIQQLIEGSGITKK